MRQIHTHVYFWNINLKTGNSALKGFYGAGSSERWGNPEYRTADSPSKCVCDVPIYRKYNKVKKPHVDRIRGHTEVFRRARGIQLLIIFGARVKCVVVVVAAAVSSENEYTHATPNNACVCRSIKNSKNPAKGLTSMNLMRPVKEPTSFDLDVNQKELEFRHRHYSFREQKKKVWDTISYQWRNTHTNIFNQSTYINYRYWYVCFVANLPDFYFGLHNYILFSEKKHKLQWYIVNETIEGP